MVPLQKCYRQLSFFIFAAWTLEASAALQLVTARSVQAKCTAYCMSELESLVSSQLTTMLQKIPRGYIGALFLF